MSGARIILRDAFNGFSNQRNVFRVPNADKKQLRVKRLLSN